MNRWIAVLLFIIMPLTLAGLVAGLVPVVLYNPTPPDPNGGLGLDSNIIETNVTESTISRTFVGSPNILHDHRGQTIRSLCAGSLSGNACIGIELQDNSDSSRVFWIGRREDDTWSRWPLYLQINLVGTTHTGAVWDGATHLIARQSGTEWTYWTITNDTASAPQSWIVPGDASIFFVPKSTQMLVWLTGGNVCSGSWSGDAPTWDEATVVTTDAQSVRMGSMGSTWTSVDSNGVVRVWSGTTLLDESTFTDATDAWFVGRSISQGFLIVQFSNDTTQIYQGGTSWTAVGPLTAAISGEFRCIPIGRNLIWGASKDLTLTNPRYVQQLGHRAAVLDNTDLAATWTEVVSGRGIQLLMAAGMSTVDTEQPVASVFSSEIW